MAFRRNDRGSRHVHAWGVSLDRPEFGTCVDCFRLSSNRPRRARGTVSPSLLAPAAELIRSTRIPNLCAILPRSKTRQDSTSPRECRAGRFCSFPLSPPRVRHAVGISLQPADFLLPPLPLNFRARSENYYGSPIKIRNRPNRTRYLS